MSSLKDRIYQTYESGALFASSVFPLLSISAYHYIMGHMVEANFAKDVIGLCPPKPNAEDRFRLQYTGVASVDNTLCMLVAFFHSILEPKPTPLTIYFMATGAVTFLFPYVESRRAGRHFVLGWPLVVGYFGQTMTIGFTLTVYWLVLIFAGATRRKTAGLSQADAEALVFALVVGMAVPTACLLILKDTAVTALWQAFPALASLSVAAHLLIRPVSRHPESGHKVILAMYIALFVISSSSHIALMWPMLSNPAALRADFLPSLTALPITSSIRDKADNLLRWDAVYSFGTMGIGSLWFARDIRQVLTLLGWYAIAFPIIGPGAAVTGVLLWRETVLAKMEAREKRD